MDFTNTKTYSREQIRRHLGGGLQDYLPHHGGVVVAACLKRSENPDAPRIILAGRSEDIRRWALQLCGQNEPLPVFLKEGSAAWRYQGLFRVRRWSEASPEIRKHSRLAGRNDITRVIYLNRARELAPHEFPAPLPASTPRAIENTTTEITTYKRGRSRALREAALERAGGVCSTCHRNFSRVAGGLGRSAIQVHHRRQLAASDRPRLTRLRDLAVVCANCHMIIHTNPRRALTTNQLRRLLEGS